ncbi:hypothetical protein ACFP1M_03700, partial [Levilactobacillus angrenensis]
HSWGMPPVMFSVITKYHKGRHSLFLYNSEIFYAFTQDILRSQHIGGYTNIKSYASKIYQEQRSKVMQLSIILGLMVGLFVFECVLACSLYFGIYQRTHAIRTLMGQSLLKTHYRFGLVLAALIISEWMASLIISQSLHLTSVYYLVDSLITFLIFYVKSKKNITHIGASLKGDN